MIKWKNRQRKPDLERVVEQQQLQQQTNGYQHKSAVVRSKSTEPVVDTSPSTTSQPVADTVDSTRTPTAPTTTVRNDGLINTQSEPAPVVPTVLQDRTQQPADSLRFDNGNFIASGGRYIDPQSAEGQTIATILERQKADRQANAQQRQLFSQVTGAENANEAIRILQAAGKLPADLKVADYTAPDTDARAQMEVLAGQAFVGPQNHVAIQAEIAAILNTKPAFRSATDQARLQELQQSLAAI